MVLSPSSCQLSVPFMISPGVYVIDCLQLNFPPRQFPLRHILLQNISCAAVLRCFRALLWNFNFKIPKNLKLHITELEVFWFILSSALLHI